MIIFQLKQFFLFQLLIYIIYKYYSPNSRPRNKKTKGYLVQICKSARNHMRKFSNLSNFDHSSINWHNIQIIQIFCLILRYVGLT